MSNETHTETMTPSQDGQTISAMSVVEVVNAANAAKNQQGANAAIAIYTEWLNSHGHADNAGGVYFNLGVIHADAGQSLQAAQCYQQALKRMPHLWQARVNLGLLFEKAGQLDQALALWQAAWPDDAGQKSLRNHMVRLGEHKGDLLLAQRSALASLAVDPEQPDVVQYLMWTRRRMCAWPSLPPELTLLGVDVQKAPLDMGPFVGLAEVEDPETQRTVARRFLDRKAAEVAPVTRYWPAAHIGATVPGEVDRPPSKKWRIGYLSGDFKWHVVSILMAEVLELHDRERVTVVAFDYSDTTETPMRKRVVAAFDEHHLLHDMSDAQAARCIYEAKVNVLVDLTGLTAGGRFGILPFRPAPLQVSYLGFMGSMGTDAVDAILVDRFLMPPELTPHFTEKPLYLDVYQANDRKRPRPAALSRQAAGLPDTALVLCAFNNNYKITESVWQCWMRILLRLHAAGIDARLWVSTNFEQAKDNLMVHARAQGVAEGWLIWSERVHPEAYLARMQCADLYLDTSPYGAGVTCSDALWVGLPVLTCPQKTLASRMAGSLLHAVGVPELIASDWQAYEDMAVRWGTDPIWAHGLKAKLTSQLESCALFDTPRFVRNLEDVLLGACQGLHAAGSAPLNQDLKEQEQT